MGNTTRARYGSGWIRQATDSKGRPVRNKWYICHSWTDGRGERQRDYETVNGTKRQAMQRLDEMKATREQGIDLEGGKTTFGEFARGWQAAREESGELAGKTLCESERYVRVMSQYIGEVRLCDLNAATIEKMLRDMRRDRRGNGGEPISGRTLQAYFQCLRQIMQKALDYDYILRNPCSKVKPPKAAEVERRALSAQDAKRLLKTLEDEAARERASFMDKELRQRERGKDGGRGAIRGLHNMSYLVCVRIGLATGMRLGEVLGLTWGAADLDAQCLHVTQSIGHDGRPKPPKTTAGKRTVWIDAETAGMLAEWKRIQGEQLVKLGIIRKGQRIPDRIPIACSDVATYANENNFGAWWRTWRGKHGFPGLKFHELRHTQATQLLANGVDVKTVQARLGHADPALTLKWYAHPIAENDRQAAAIVGGILAS